MDYQNFCSKWLARAERAGTLDEGDKFLCLWTSFSAWMESRYGTDKTDKFLVGKTARDADAAGVFAALKETNPQFQKELDVLSFCRVADSRNPSQPEAGEKYRGDFKSFIKVVYQIRCNLFYGTADPEAEKNETYLVKIALKTLLPFFKELLSIPQPVSQPVVVEAGEAMASGGEGAEEKN